MDNVIDNLKASKKWVIIMVVFNILTLIPNIIMDFYTPKVQGAQAIFSLAMTIPALYAIFILIKYIIAVNRIDDNDMEQVDLACQLQGWYIKFLGIFTAIILAMVPIFMIVSIYTLSHSMH